MQRPRRASSPGSGTSSVGHQDAYTDALACVKSVETRVYSREVGESYVVLGAADPTRDSLYLATSKGTLTERSCDAPERDLREVIPGSAEAPLCMTCSHDTITLGYETGEVAFIDISTFTVTARDRRTHAGASVTACCAGGADGGVYTGDTQGRVASWHGATGDLKKVVDRTGQKPVVSLCCGGASGEYVAAACEGAVFVSKADDCVPFWKYQPTDGTAITCASFSTEQRPPRGLDLWCGTESGDVLVFCVLKSGKTGLRLPCAAARKRQAPQRQRRLSGRPLESPACPSSSAGRSSTPPGSPRAAAASPPLQSQPTPLSPHDHHHRTSLPPAAAPSPAVASIHAAGAPPLPAQVWVSYADGTLAVYSGASKKVTHQQQVLQLQPHRPPRGGPADGKAPQGGNTAVARRDCVMVSVRPVVSVGAWQVSREARKCLLWNLAVPVAQGGKGASPEQDPDEQRRPPSAESDCKELRKKVAELEDRLRHAPESSPAKPRQAVDASSFPSTPRLSVHDPETPSANPSGLAWSNPPTPLLSPFPTHIPPLSPAAPCFDTHKATPLLFLGDPSRPAPTHTDLTDIALVHSIADAPLTFESVRVVQLQEEYTKVIRSLERELDKWKRASARHQRKPPAKVGHDEFLNTPGFDGTVPTAATTPSRLDLTPNTGSLDASHVDNLSFNTNCHTPSERYLRKSPADPPIETQQAEIKALRCGLEAKAGAVVAKERELHAAAAENKRLAAALKELRGAAASEKQRAKDDKAAAAAELAALKQQQARQRPARPADEAKLGAGDGSLGLLPDVKSLGKLVYMAVRAGSVAKARIHHTLAAAKEKPEKSPPPAPAVCARFDELLAYVAATHQCWCNIIHRHCSPSEQPSADFMLPATSGLEMARVTAVLEARVLTQERSETVHTGHRSSKSPGARHRGQLVADKVKAAGAKQQPADAAAVQRSASSGSQDGAAVLPVRSRSAGASHGVRKLPFAAKTEGGALTPRRQQPLPQQQQQQQPRPQNPNRLTLPPGDLSAGAAVQESPRRRNSALPGSAPPLTLSNAKATIPTPRTPNVRSISPSLRGRPRRNEGES
ncbi:hypothetical protein DIPPA_13682 [Diplonema papillatum]|nr:hypothetical protein DIPPA_13682 [Diplonema papillatum]